MGENMVSVIIPTYNSKDYICDAIDSVLMQTYKNLEIIIVDDGSTDSTKLQLKKYGGKIKYFFQQNKGPSSARNVGIKKSIGEYIVFLDSDDIWDKSFLEKMISFFEADRNLDFAFSDCYNFGKNGIISKSFLEKIGFFNDFSILANKEMGFRLDKNILEYFIFKKFLVPSTVIIKKKCLEEVEYFDEELRYGEIWNIFFKLLYRFNAGFYNSSLVGYRIHDKNTSKLIDQQYALKSIIVGTKKVMQKYPSLTHKIKNKLYWRLSSNYFYLGYYFFKSKKYVEAKKYFIKSITAKINIASIGYLLFAFIPCNLINKICLVKQPYKKAS